MVVVVVTLARIYLVESGRGRGGRRSVEIGQRWCRGRRRGRRLARALHQHAVHLVLLRVAAWHVVAAILLLLLYLELLKLVVMIHLMLLLLL